MAVTTTDSERIINFTGSLGIDSVNEISTSLLKFISEDESKDEKDREVIKLYINSFGGDAEMVFGLVDIIECSKTPIYTYAYGACQSAAVCLFLAGHKRYTYHNTQFMIHKPVLNSDIPRTLAKINCDCTRMNILERRIRTLLIDKCNIPENLIDDVFAHDAELYIQSSDLREYGIATYIL